jgi:hypothetical protein
VFYEYSCFNSVSTFVQVIYVFICVCLRLFCLCSFQFVCAINLLITCMFLSTVLINVVVFVQLNLTVGNFEHGAWGSRILTHHDEVGKQISADDLQRGKGRSVSQSAESEHRSRSVLLNCLSTKVYIQLPKHIYKLKRNAYNICFCVIYHVRWTQH